MTNTVKPVRRTIDFDNDVYQAIYADAKANDRTFPAQLRVVLKEYADQVRANNQDYADKMGALK